MRTILIEDERKSLIALKNLLEEFCPTIIIVAMANNVEEGLILIKKHQPDLLFLDIEMRSSTGFDLLERLGDFSFEMIFTTAYSQYAIKAIRYNALDYLLKPIDVSELKAAIEKVKRKQALFLSKEIALVKSSKITIATSEGIYFIETDNIQRCEADGAYTKFYLCDNRKIIVSKNIKEYEQLLRNFNFMRIHNSHLINLKQVDKYIRSDGGQVVLKDGICLPLSILKKEQFLQKMSSVK